MSPRHLLLFCALVFNRSEKWEESLSYRSGAGPRTWGSTPEVEPPLQSIS